MAQVLPASACLPSTRRRERGLARVCSNTSIATAVLSPSSNKRPRPVSPTSETSEASEEPQWRFSSLCDTIECAAGLVGLASRGQPWLQSKRRAFDQSLKRKTSCEPSNQKHAVSEMRRGTLDRRRKPSPRPGSTTSTPCHSRVQLSALCSPLPGYTPMPTSPCSIMSNGLHPDVRSHIGRGWTPELLMIALELGAPVPSVFGSLRRRSVGERYCDASHETLSSTFGM